jgi:hypothetical protein
MTLFKVNRRILQNGKTFLPGSQIDLTDKQAAQMKNGQISPMPAEVKKAAAPSKPTTPGAAPAGQQQKPPKDPPQIDYVKASAFLQSRGYKVETPEEAEKFVAAMSEADQASVVAGLAEFTKAQPPSTGKDNTTAPAK